MKRISILIVALISPLFFQTDAIAARIILDTVTDSGTSLIACRKTKTSSFITVPPRTYHTMGIDSTHWIVRNGSVQGIHFGNNNGFVLLGFSQVVEQDKATVLQSYKNSRVYMDTDYWAFSCGTAGGQLREINAHRSASQAC